MFSLSLFGKFQVYSTEGLAAQNGATFVKGMFDNSNRSEPFRTSLQQEKYSECVIIWNEFVDRQLLGNSIYKIIIKPVVVDAKFG